ncbi:MAG: antitermination protein NusB [Coriobacteriia bacterium]|nr:antitermination protein NusB [Coriobacteriia bacterium]
MSVAPARAAALEVLGEVRRRHGYAPAVLEAVLDRRGPGPRDRALATRLAYGTLQAEGVLDEALERFLDRPGSVEPKVRDALRLAAYELLFARTPPRAAVNEGVEAVRRARREAAPMANAVLRRLAEEAPSFPWGDPASDDGALARATAHPRWLVDSLIADLGRDTASRVLAAHCEPAPLYLAHNPFRGGFEALVASLSEDGAEPRACDPMGCVLCASPSHGVRSRALAEGLAVVMDAAAQVAPLVLGALPGEVVADLAAGRGGKTMLVQAHAVAAGGRARLFALDVHPFKVEVLRGRMRRLGVPGVTALVGDATDPSSIEGLPAAGGLDRVLLDAPCSNLGTLRRHPERRWRLRRDDLERLSGLQSRLLASAASLVRPGGVVVYSTCSISRIENEDVVGAFLAGEGKGFFARPLGGAVPAGMRRFVAAEGWFRSLPERDGPDGHFVAALERAS